MDLHYQADTEPSVRLRLYHGARARSPSERAHAPACTCCQSVCVFQDNEDIGLDIASDLYQTAKQLDPSRPVNTADGLWGNPASCCGNTDFQVSAH
jgi:hypothetical protein